MMSRGKVQKRGFTPLLHSLALMVLLRFAWLLGCGLGFTGFLPE